MKVPRLDRRAFLRRGLAATALLPASCALPLRNPAPAGQAGQARPAARERPVETPAPGSEAFSGFDREIRRFMEARGVPGGALAVVQDGRLVYAQAYGWADREARRPVTIHSQFRIASLSKPITAAAVLKLVEMGRLELGAKAFEGWFERDAEPPGAGRDPRLARVTIRQLLQHTGGWDREEGFDPMFRPVEIARELGQPPPAGPSDVIRYMLRRPLDFDPGTRYAYSNFGYCVLGRLIERAGGRAYEAAVREAVLAPCGIRAMRLGASLEGGRAPGEVRYYLREPADVTPVFSGLAGRVPVQYGGFNLEAMDAHGGWIASVVDLARFAAGVQHPERGAWLGSAALAELTAPPPPPAWRGAAGRLEGAYYGLGWMVRPDPATGRPHLWHSGSLPGTASLMVLSRDGLAWVALFNQRSEDPRQPDSALDPALHRAAGRVRAWPRHDLFPTFE